MPSPDNFQPSVVDFTRSWGNLRQFAGIYIKINPLAKNRFSLTCGNRGGITLAVGVGGNLGPDLFDDFPEASGFWVAES